MLRKQFLGNFIGLIGVTTNLKELSLINTPLVEYLPASTMPGDLLTNNSEKIFYFTGREIIELNEGKFRRNAILSKSKSKYHLFARAFTESQTSNMLYGKTIK